MKNIFIISKEAIITQKLTDFLRSQAFVTHASHDLDLAAKMITEKKIDVIIMDMSFKEECVHRFNQLVLMKKIKIPTLYLCDIPSKGNYLKGLSLMTHNFLIKPFKPNELTNILKTII